MNQSDSKNSELQHGPEAMPAQHEASVNEPGAISGEATAVNSPSATPTRNQREGDSRVSKGKYVRLTHFRQTFGG